MEPSRNRQNTFVTILIYTLLSSWIIYAQVPRVTALTVTDSHVLNALFPDRRSENGEQLVYYFVEKENRFKRFTQDFKGVNPSVSPNGSYVAFVGIRANGGELWDDGLNADARLVLFSSDGKFLKNYAVRPGRYDWSPGEDRIAFLEYPPSKEAAEVCSPAFGVLDLKTGKVSRVLLRAYDLKWASHDQNIYVLAESLVVYRYRTADGILERTQYRDINFSPDGRYYFQGRSEIGFRIFDSIRNIDITGTIWKDTVAYLGFHRWIGKAAMLVVGDFVGEKQVIDVASHRVLKAFAGYLVRYDEVSKEVVVYKDKRHFKSLSESNLERIKIE